VSCGRGGKGLTLLCFGEVREISFFFGCGRQRGRREPAEDCEEEGLMGILFPFLHMIV
jgi:hypothetical protein